jgi:nucleotide-binding universal stress UspA family protein
VGRLLSRWRGPTLAGTGLAAHLDRARELVGGGEGDSRDHFLVRQVCAPDVAAAVLQEAVRDYDLVLMGAAPDRALEDPLAVRIVRDCPVPLVLVRDTPTEVDLRAAGKRAIARGDTGGAGESTSFRSLLVPFDGSIFSRYAAELAFAYAGATCSDVRVLHVVNEQRLVSGSIPVPERADRHELARARVKELEAQLERELGPLAAAHGARMTVRILASAAPGEIIIGESRSGYYDLLVLGAQNKQLARPLFFGQGTAEIVARAGCTTVVVLPGTL